MVEDRGERFDAWQVRAGQDLQLLASVIGELEVYATLIERVALAADQPGALRTLSELDRAVVAYVQRLARPDRSSAPEWWGGRARQAAADAERG